MTDTVVLSFVEFAGQPAELFLATATDGTAKELVTYEAGASLGDFAGQTLTRLTAQAGDGSILSQIEILDAAGGQLAIWSGCERNVAVGAASNTYNLKSQRVALKIERGMTIMATTAD